jgi:hypothetical protein
MQDRQPRSWILIAAVAIAFALLLLLVPPMHHGNGADFVAILPLLLVAILSPLGLLGPLGDEYAGRTPQTPVLAAAFQRPPPSRRR